LSETENNIYDDMMISNCFLRRKRAVSVSHKRSHKEYYRSWSPPTGRFTLSTMHVNANLSEERSFICELPD